MFVRRINIVVVVGKFDTVNRSIMIGKRLERNFFLHVPLVHNQVINSSIFTIKHLSFPNAHKLTFRSCPPVTKTRPVSPKSKHLTFCAWASISSAKYSKINHISQSLRTSNQFNNLIEKSILTQTSQT